MKSLVACSKQSFFPHFHINEVELTLLQQQLCACFMEWGLPQSIKVDNGKPFGDPQHSSIPMMALWLIAVGVKVTWNRPRSPRDNAKVERMQATTSRWAEIQTCSTGVELQSKLDEVAQLQREKYPVRRLGHQSRKQCYPELWNNSRKYGSHCFDVSRVNSYLSQVTFMRKVNKSGAFSFYAQCVYLGCSYSGKTISLRYDLQNKRFIIEEAGSYIACLTADNFSAEHIEGLRVCRNKYVTCSNFMSD